MSAQQNFLLRIDESHIALQDPTTSTSPTPHPNPFYPLLAAAHSFTPYNTSSPFPSLQKSLVC